MEDPYYTPLLDRYVAPTSIGGNLGIGDILFSFGDAAIDFHFFHKVNCVSETLHSQTFSHESPRTANIRQSKWGNQKAKHDVI